MGLPSPEDALAGYSFCIEIDGVTVAQFKEVSGINAEIQTIEHRENKIGGLPVLKKLPGARKWGDLTLKRGRTDNKALWDWIKQVQDGNMPAARKNGSIVLFDYAHGEVVALQLHQRLALEGQSSARSTPAATTSSSRKSPSCTKGCRLHEPSA